MHIVCNKEMCCANKANCGQDEKTQYESNTQKRATRGRRNSRCVGLFVLPFSQKDIKMYMLNPKHRGLSATKLPLAILCFRGYSIIFLFCQTTCLYTWSFQFATSVNAMLVSASYLSRLNDHISSAADKVYILEFSGCHDVCMAFFLWWIIMQKQLPTAPCFFLSCPVILCDICILTHVHLINASQNIGLNAHDCEPEAAQLYAVSIHQTTGKKKPRSVKATQRGGEQEER